MLISPQNCPVQIARVGEWLHLHFPYNKDFSDDIKALPRHARRYDKDKRAWLVLPAYFPAIADFVLAHYGVDLTPERSQPEQPATIMALEDFLEMRQG